MPSNRKISELPTDAAPARTDFLTSLENGILNVKGLVSSFLGLTKDTDLNLTDVTTNDVSIGAHGFTPKAPSDTTQVLKGDGAWGVSDYALIAESLLGADAASVTFSSIPQTFRHLRLVCYGRTTQAVTNGFLFIRFNNDSGSNYDDQVAEFFATTPSVSQTVAQTRAKIGTFPGTSSSTTTQVGMADVIIPHYAGGTFEKIARSSGGHKQGTTAGNFEVADYLATWRSVAAIIRLDVLPAANEFKAGSLFSLYGMR